MTASENEALMTCDNCHENLDTGHCVMKPYEGKMKISELMIVLMSLISNEMTHHDFMTDEADIWFAGARHLDSMLRLC